MIGSSDLPNVIRTVNELPSRFTGELVILLNGYKQPVSFIRSVLALLILTIITDIPLAAETALHFLTSAFYQIPHDHVRQFVARDLIMAVKSGNTFSLDLGKNSTIRGIISETSLNRLLEHAKRRASFEHATLEYKKARCVIHPVVCIFITTVIGLRSFIAHNDTISSLTAHSTGF